MTPKTLTHRGKTLVYRGLLHGGELSQDALRVLNVIATLQEWPLEVRHLPYTVEVWAPLPWMESEFIPAMQNVFMRTLGFTWLEGRRVRAVLIKYVERGGYDVRVV